MATSGSPGWRRGCSARRTAWSSTRPTTTPTGSWSASRQGRSTISRTSPERLPRRPADSLLVEDEVLRQAGQLDGLAGDRDEVVEARLLAGRDHPQRVRLLREEGAEAGQRHVVAVEVQVVGQAAEELGEDQGRVGEGREALHLHAGLREVAGEHAGPGRAGRARLDGQLVAQVDVELGVEGRVG